jgi:hypothetical protein
MNSGKLSGLRDLAPVYEMRVWAATTFCPVAPIRRLL